MFTFELLLRLFAHGFCSFFIVQGWTWNCFDFFVVGLQLFEIAIKKVMTSNTMSVNLSFIRVIRLIRIVRITRIIKLLRFIEELRAIVTSIACSMKSLGWTLVLLFMMIYTLSIAATQICIDHIRNYPDAPEVNNLEEYYGSLYKTIGTLYESVCGGLEWKNAVDPLISISPCLALGFSFYIAFCIFAVMNVVTGVFVERAIQGSQADKQEYMARHLCSVAFKEGGLSNVIDLAGFKVLMETEEMKSYFQEIEVCMPDAHSFFNLLDTNSNGVVDVVEFLSNCMRLRGPAKALELSLHIRDSERRYEWFESHILGLETRLAWICKALDPCPGEPVPTPPSDDKVLPLANRQNVRRTTQ